MAAGSCGGCEAELTALGNVVFDMARFGVQFVASPRHADGVVVSGIVSANMRDALEKTYNAVPDPKIVIAVGACAISGGPFKQGYNVLKGIDRYIPVDVYIPGCPPRPEALLYGLMRLQDIIMREAPSAYLFESDGSVHRNRQFEDEVEVSPQEAARLATAPLR